ncbi:hypothetical protein NOR_03979 [Metarhizium rileyi]|uniref:Uncharacterized protein n=1 Tax=Metarhizium rileyi (strain RCEF 4871) TaxID=1649241 RepID=A0A167EPN6_METRR|nr:hypothetical protein NOR_03979 [Metarhizium rileyi RCEF 4871]TWU75700.1 hypothetical protein ED733_007481 [Metarhizium rileyi]
MGHAERHESSPHGASPISQGPMGSPALARRGTASDSGSSENGVCSQCSCRSPKSQNYRTSQHASPRPLSRTYSGRDGPIDDELFTPPRRTSPSVASSMTFSNPGSGVSPLRRDLSHANVTVPEGIDAVTSRAARHDLARRLSQLARRLTYDGSDNVDEMMVGSQLEQLERVVGGTKGADSREAQQQTSFDSPRRSDVGSVLGSPVSSLFRSRFSDLSASLHREREAEREQEDEAPSKKGMTGTQANKVIAEMGKLNAELSTVVNNLKARQEESEHIQGLLIERAERAAQRIIFLQSRITYLEEELQENDGELQHLRICLKAVEIQMPPHPDKELQRCVTTFKDDYQALKRKRAHRASMANVRGFDPPRLGAPLR